MESVENIIKNNTVNLLFGSITSLLSEISKNTKESNVFLNNIYENINGLLTNFGSKLGVSNSLFSLKIGNSKKQNSTDFSDTNNILKNILDKLDKLKVDLTFKKGSAKNFISVVKAITSNVKEKTVNLFTGLVDAWERIISETNTKKLIVVGTQLTIFSTVLRLVGVLLNNVAGAFKGVALGIALLTIMVILPPFQIGTAYLIGFLFALRHAMGGKSAFGMVFSFGSLTRSILLMGAGIFLIGKISWANVYKLLFFLAGLAGVLRLFKEKTASKTVNISKKFEISGIFSASLGIALLVLSIDSIANISFQSAGALILFIAGLGLTLFMLNKMGGMDKSPFENMFDFGLGITLMVVALSLIGEISWGGVFKLLGFIVGVGIALAIANKLMGTGNGKNSIRARLGVGFGVHMSGMFGFAAGIAILILTIGAAKDLDWMSALKLLVFITAIGFSIALTSRFNKGGKTQGIFGFAMGIAILLLTIAAAGEIDWTPALYIIGFVTAINLILKYLSPKNIWTLMLFSAGITALSISMYLFSLVNIKLEQTINFALAVGILVLTMYTVQKMMLQSLMGVGGLLLISLVALTIGVTLYLLSKIELDILKIGLFLLTIIGITLTFIYLEPLLALATFGAGMALTLGLAILLVAIPLMLIQDLTFENVGAFLLAINGIAVSLFLLLPQLTIAVVSAALLIVIGVATTIVAGALIAISELDFNQKNLNDFKLGIITITDTYEELSIWSLTKSVAKTVLLLPILIVTILTAFALKTISGLDINANKIDNFGIILSKFIQVTVDAINKSMKGLKSAEPGLKALMKITNISSTLVDMVRSFANMTYNVYEVKDGKIKLVEVRKINDDEIGKVGLGVGRLIEGLLRPLNVLSSDDEYWNFNGLKVKNPFKGGFFGTDKNSGLKRMKKIGEAFKPLVDSLGQFASLQISQNPQLLKNFDMAMTTGIMRMNWAFQQLEGWKNQNSKNSIQNIANLIYTFKALEIDKINSISDSMKKLMETLSDNNRWTKINRNLEIMSNNFKGIVKNINMLDMEKALVFERNIKMMTEKNSSDNLEKIVDGLKEIFGLIKDSQETQTKIIQTMVGGEPETSSNSIVKKESPEVTKQNSLFELMTIIKDNLEEFNDKLGGVNTKLAGKLKVSIIKNNENSI